MSELVWLPGSLLQSDAMQTIQHLSKLIAADDRFEWVSNCSLDDSANSDVTAVAVRGAANGDAIPNDHFLARCRSSAKNAKGSEGGFLLECESIPQFVWPAAAPLVRWILRHRSLVEGKTVLELGCGSGALGFAISKLAKRLVLSDCSYAAIALVSSTMEVQRTTNCLAAVLRWGYPDLVDELKQHLGIQFFDVVVGSDVFYLNSLLKAGLTTARAALADIVPVASEAPVARDRVFLCGSVARSERMEADLDSVPLDFGFVARRVESHDALKIYEWHLTVAPAAVADAGVAVT